MGCFGSSNPALAEACKGKTQEQKKVIEYFCKEEGCMSKNMTDDAYLAQVRAKRDSLNLKQKAIAKTGLDEDEIKEISPAVFEGFVFSKAYSKKRANGNWVSSRYQVSWLFFSSTQVFLYSHIFNMDDDDKKVTTEDYFYKDVITFSTVSETETSKDREGKDVTVETEFCSMKITDGSKFMLALNGGSDAERIIQGIKAKIREKRQQ